MYDYHVLQVKSREGDLLKLSPFWYFFQKKDIFDKSN